MSLVRSYLFLLLSCGLLGTIGVLVKLIGSSIPIMTLVFYRVLLAFLFLLAVVPFIDKNTFKISKKDLRDYFFIGLLFAVSFSFFVSAFFLAPIQNVALINAVYPFFVLIFAYFLLKERITLTKIITLVIAFIGMAIINPFNAGDHALGNFLSLMAALVYAFLLTLLRREDKTHSIGDVLWFFFFALVLLLPFPFIYGFGNVSSVIVYVLLIGFFSTGLAFLLLNLALERIEAEIVSITGIIVSPIVAIALGVLIIGEPLDAGVLEGGSLLILAGLYLETHSRKLKFLGRHKRK